MWNLPGPEIEPMCPAWAGRSLSTGPPRKSSISFEGATSHYSRIWTSLATTQGFKKHKASSGGSVVKNPPANTGDAGSIPGSGRLPGEGNGLSFQYSCLENPVDREAWKATVHSVAKSQTWLKWLSMQALAYTAYTFLAFSGATRKIYITYVACIFFLSFFF